MPYAKVVLSAFVAIILADFVSFWPIFRSTKAMGLAALVGGSIENLFSIQFWIIGVLGFALFYAASRIGNKLLRILLFWTPTLSICSVVILMTGLIGYLILHVRHLR